MQEESISKKRGSQTEAARFERSPLLHLSAHLRYYPSASSPLPPVSRKAIVATESCPFSAASGQQRKARGRQEREKGLPAKHPLFSHSFVAFGPQQGRVG